MPLGVAGAVIRGRPAAGGAAPTFEAFSVNSTSGLSVAVTVPAGSGTLLLAFVAGTNAAVNLHGSWTDSGLGSFSVPASAGLFGRWMWREVSSEPANYTFSLAAGGSKINAGIIRIVGADTGVPIHKSAFAQINAAAQYTAPSVTTTVTDTLLIYGLVNPFGVIGFGAPLDGQTNIYERLQGGGGDPKTATVTAYLAHASAAASGVKRWTNSAGSDPAIGTTLALKA